MGPQASADGAPGGGGERHVAPGGAARSAVVPPPASRAQPPRTTWQMVSRPHLVRRITTAVEQAPFVLLRAPAGTGKTVLAADWARHRAQAGQPAAWLTMTERDNQLGVFWAHLREALVLAGALPAGTDERASGSAAEDVDGLSAVILQRSSPVEIVIDAADRVHAPAVYDQVGSLLDAGGDLVRVVMTSRVEPPLPIHRYRVEDRVAELGAAELALDRHEIDEVLARHRLRPSPSATDRILDRTEGWAAGVRLAALHMAAEGAQVELDGFAAPYVREEIVAGFTTAELEVLSAASVVDELPPGLAPALSQQPDADALLHTLAAGNAFVLPVHGRPGILRMHPLVRELLRDDLDQRSPARALALHRKAASWFDDHGDLASAVRHVTSTGDWQAAATFIVAGRGLVQVIAGTATGAAIAELLAPMPESGSSAAALLRAALAVRAGDLAAARRALDRAAAAPDLASLERPASLVRTAWCDAAGYPVETLAAARETRSLLATADTPDPLRAAILATAEGRAHLRLGDLEAASVALGEAVSATAGGEGPLRLRCLSELALTEACAGHLSRSLGLVELADRSAAAQRIGVASRPAPLELARAWVAVERQDLAQAQRSLNRLARGRTGRLDPTWRTVAVLLQARYLRDRDDLRGARRHLDQGAASAGWLRVLLDAEARYLDVGEQPHPHPQSGVAGRVQGLVDRADRCCRAGDVASARVELGRALQLGRPERLRRPFVHASEQVRSLIRNDAWVHAMAGWLGFDQTAATGVATSAGTAVPVLPPMLDELSERELEVLRHLAAFLTTEEIAAEMFISINTVRSHVRRVLEKLAVSRRHEAVRRGQELGLV